MCKSEHLIKTQRKQRISLTAQNVDSAFAVLLLVFVCLFVCVRCYNNRQIVTQQEITTTQSQSTKRTRHVIVTRDQFEQRANAHQLDEIHAVALLNMERERRVKRRRTYAKSRLRILLSPFPLSLPNPTFPPAMTSPRTQVHAWRRRASPSVVCIFCFVRINR
jgi:hypothetical protein